MRLFSQVGAGQTVAPASVASSKHCKSTTKGGVSSAVSLCSRRLFFLTTLQNECWRIHCQTASAIEITRHLALVSVPSGVGSLVLNNSPRQTPLQSEQRRLGSGGSTKRAVLKPGILEVLRKREKGKQRSMFKARQRRFPRPFSPSPSHSLSIRSARPPTVELS